MELRKAADAMQDADNRGNQPNSPAIKTTSAKDAKNQ